MVQIASYMKSSQTQTKAGKGYQYGMAASSCEVNLEHNSTYITYINGYQYGMAASSCQVNFEQNSI
jgi:hypothetical protein